MSQQDLRLLRAGFRLGDYWISPQANEIGSVRIYSKSMEVLLLLAEVAPDVVSGQSLLARVWSDVVVVDNVVHQALAQLRRALDDDAHEPKYIESIPRRGYRLIADVDCEECLLDGESGRELKRKPRLPSIAVLPLTDVSPDLEQLHFVDGLTIELIDRLSRIPGLRVAGQAPSFAYKGRHPVDYTEVGRALGVAHLLEGSVRSAGKRLRVTMQLVSCADSFQLWSADFDRHVDDVLEIQREVSEAVANALTMVRRSTSLELSGNTRNPLAHAHYLRGNALLWHHTLDTTERAIAELQRAVEIDPAYARAWVLLSQTFGARARQTALTEQSLRDMLHAVERALHLEPQLWRAHSAKGWYLLSRRRFLAADAAMNDAIRLRNGQESIIGPEVMYYMHQVGRWTERLAESERLQCADSVHGINHEAYYVLGRKEEARDSYERLKGLSPAADREYLHMLAMDQTNAEEADKRFEGFSKTPLGRGWFGERDRVLPAMRQVLAKGNGFRGDFAFSAMIAAHHGDVDLAMSFLRAEYLVDGFGAWHVLWFPQLREVRATAQFKALLIELGLPEMWQATGSWGDFCEPVGNHDFRCW
jgi:TolB-like protein